MGGHGHSAEDLQKELKGYYIVFGSLIVLTIVTVLVAKFHLPIHWAVAVALFVAFIKGTLVACYFMHLINEKKIIYWITGFTAFFFVSLIGLTVHDEIEDIVGSEETSYAIQKEMGTNSSAKHDSHAGAASGHGQEGKSDVH